MFLAQEAGNRAQKLYGAAAGGDPQMSMPSYQVGPMGMMGTPVETNAQGASQSWTNSWTTDPANVLYTGICTECLMLKQQFSLLELTNK